MSSSEFRAALAEQALEFGLSLDPAVVERFTSHYELLVRWTKKLNLTRIVEPRAAARLHFLESAFLTTLVQAPSVLVDVGSGAGFPGLPIASVWEHTSTILVEPLVKRSVFLKEVVRTLGLGSVRVLNAKFDPAMIPPGSLLVSRALDGFASLLPSLFESEAGTLALFTDPELLDQAQTLEPHSSFRSVPISGSDRRYIGLFNRE